MKTVLVVDDDLDIRLLFRLVLESTGHRVVAEATNGEDALATLGRLDPPPIPDVVVLDNRMDRMTGLEAAVLLRDRHPGLPIILCSAFLNDLVEAEAEEVGIAACLRKESYLRLPHVIHEVLAGVA